MNSRGNEINGCLRSIVTDQIDAVVDQSLTQRIRASGPAKHDHLQPCQSRNPFRTLSQYLEGIRNPVENLNIIALHNLKQIVMSEWQTSIVKVYLFSGSYSPEDAAEPMCVVQRQRDESSHIHIILVVPNGSAMCLVDWLRRSSQTARVNDPSDLVHLFRRIHLPI